MFKKFTSEYPVLETVILDKCNMFSDLSSVYITNPSVKFLGIMDSTSSDGDLVEGGVEIYAPNVLFLDIGGQLRPQYSLINVSSLVSAKLAFHFYNIGSVSVLKGLLSGSNCHSLHLCSWCIQVCSFC